MKLCVFQGTFNPIHNAHLAMARYTKQVYDYDTILFIPAYKPPHKEFDDDLANHRFQMVKLAVSGESFFGISNIEFQNEKYSYTYLTIQELYKRYKIDGKIGFIIGFDAFREITEWYEADKLKELVNFIVFPRETEIDRDRVALLHYKGYHFSIAKMHPISISSTMLREKLIQRQPVSGMIPPVVMEYIRENELYKNE
ncbi:MAG: nicotinate (nicotinamide) nucleotide adenylyltransferase [Candidatus Gastranaerophilales bacterium]|nr:nicotinate (nicotinamide) nucleotide adenylyltransferase [Candidatus Gastranaerophilales bacterium]